MSKDRQKLVKPTDLQEFREGAREFVEELSRCPACAIKLALELVDSESLEEKQLLKDLIARLGEKLMELEAGQRSVHAAFRSFPLIEGWLKGEIGLGLIAKLLGVKNNDKM